MPLLRGWHFVNSRDKAQGVRAPDGRIVSRTEAERTGANWLGYSSEYSYRKGKSARDAYLRDVLQSRQGRDDITRAREHARRQGQRFDEREYRRTLTALHNAERDSRGDPVNRGPDSPIARFHDLTGADRGRGWEQFITGTDTP